VKNKIKHHQTLAAIKMPISLYRSTLLFESAANIATCFQMIIDPETSLTNLVKDAAQITPATKSLTQWVGGVMVLTAVPLLLSYPENAPAGEIRARRKLTYQMIGISEVARGSSRYSRPVPIYGWG
jgi:Trk-type K+ transport system membrane component